MSETVLDQWERYVAQGGLNPSLDVFTALLRLARAAENIGLDGFDGRRTWCQLCEETWVEGEQPETHEQWCGVPAFKAALAPLLEPAG